MALLIVVTAAAAIWWRTRPTTMISATGVSLGRFDTDGPLNLLVVTLDTTRADRIGAYGLADAGTPAMDRLAREGTLFVHATSAAPLTLPSHASMFTGRFPPAHGVRDNGGFFLDAREQTLAEALGGAGLETGGFVAAYVLDSKWGVDQGFAKYVDDFDLSKDPAISLGAIQRPGNEVVDHAVEWLNTVAGSRFFAWVHLYDPHTPYEAPAAFASRFPGRPYQAEISFADSQVGRLVAFLEARHLLDRTVIVVVGDHGESLGDHGEQSHGFFVYESVTHVPLIVRTPFALTRGRRVDDPVRTVDIAPTVLDLLGVKSSGAMDGRSLVPLLTGATREMGLEAYSEALYPLHHFGWSDLRALREGRYKVIAAPRPELYDLTDDPLEKTNIFASRSALGERMLQRIDQMELEWKSSGTAQPDTPVEVDPDARARLAALGYVGSFVATTPKDSDRASLADPKDKVDLFNRISRARDATRDPKAFDDVVQTLQSVVAEDPKVIDAWFMLGNVHAAHGQPSKAIEFFKRALALKPDDEMAVINMANAYRSLGRDDEALTGYQRFLQLDPKNAQVRYEVAQIFIDRDRLDDATVELRQALAVEPKLAAARNALGVIAIRRGDLNTGEQEIRAALAQKADVRLAHFNLALIAEGRGDDRTALAEYQQELEGHPAASYKAAFNLGKLHERLGNAAGQEQAYRKAIEINPRFAEGYFYLAKFYLDRGSRLAEAAALAEKGLEIAPDSDYAALGHYVLADLYNRRGLMEDSRREAAKGRASEAAARPRRGPAQPDRN